MRNRIEFLPVEIKLVRIILTLAGLVFGMFAAVWLLRLPYPLAVFGMVIAAPILAILIWRHKSRVLDD